MVEGDCDESGCEAEQHLLELSLPPLLILLAVDWLLERSSLVVCRLLESLEVDEPGLGW